MSNKVSEAEAEAEVSEKKGNVKAMPVSNQNPVYDPAKQYTWTPDTRFVLTGEEFGLWLNFVREQVSSAETMKVRMLLECNNTLENLMKEGVEAGKITEVVK